MFKISRLADVRPPGRLQNENARDDLSGSETGAGGAEKTR
jgi:hypothetical protein